MLLGASNASAYVDVGMDPPAYLGTFFLDVSPDATDGSTFEVSISPGPSSNLFNAYDFMIPFTVPGACTLTVSQCQAYGDMDDDCDVDIDDILCTLNGFAAGQDWQGACPLADLYGDDPAPCMPDGIINLGDILAQLDAYAGAPPCP